MTAWLTGKIAGPVFAGTSALLLIALITTGAVAHFRIADRDATIRSRDGDIAHLRESIDEPLTGWAARLGQCQANFRTVSAGFDQMAASIKRLGQETVAAAAAAKRAADAAAAESRDARMRADQILALPAPAAAEACTSAARLLKGVLP